ncbi:MAG: polysaccharide biosynthesis/export family protein [Candidatus Binataceae bacterium]
MTKQARRRGDAFAGYGTAARAKRMGLLACGALLALAICGCAANSESNNGDAPGGVQNASAMSPDQCMANGAIEKAAENDQRGYIIQPGDDLQVGFYLNPEFNDDVTVRPDGKITLRLVGDVQAAGQTPEQLANALDKDYLRELRNPGAVIHVKSMPDREVYVQGQVNKPGEFPLEPGMTALQAISDAGGETDVANKTAVVIRRDACGIPRSINISLANAVKDPSGGEDLALMPRDILVVPRSSIGSVDLFVKQYIRDMLPVEPYMSASAPL